MEKRALKTLERVISKAGLGSRTQARSWIGQGRVRVNGREVQNPDHWIDLERDKVLFDGKPLRAAAKRYILLHKPAGYITTFKDPERRPTVYDLIVAVDTFVSPVGRLDLETSGLLILTNDHGFAERMTNPEFKVPKTYRVVAEHAVMDGELERLARGVELKDGPTRPATVQRIDALRFDLTITEGRNRQVRRMLEAIDNKVDQLTRIAIGHLQLKSLPEGGWRDLNSAEIKALQISKPSKLV